MKEIKDQWDAVVVGAGVGGGCIAALLADKGWTVLLVEKSAWPRATTCGGCLSAAAIGAIHAIGMGSAITHARPTRSVIWQRRDQKFEHKIPTGAAILRCKLDAGIVAEAVRRGVRFLPGCCATLLSEIEHDRPARRIRLQMADRTRDVRAQIVIACDGISGSLLKHEPWATWTLSPGAFLGVSATYQSEPIALPAATINMCMGRHGYVGRVRIDEQTEHLGAALNPVVCRNAGGPLKLVSEILHSCGEQVPAELASSRLYGEGKLTRHRKTLGGHRVLTLGDACGYVEPITGEGMACAAVGALELNRLLPESAAEWPLELPGRWRMRHWEIIGRQQRYCRALKSVAHHPALAGAGILLGNVMPVFARSVARAICQPTKRRT